MSIPSHDGGVGPQVGPHCILYRDRSSVNGIDPLKREVGGGVAEKPLKAVLTGSSWLCKYRCLC